MGRRRGSSDVTRREFLAKAGAAAAASAGAAAGLWPVHSEAAGVPSAQASPNDKLVLGLIGCGGMGAANMRNLMGHPDVTVAALCDVDENRIPNDFKDVENKYGVRPKVYKDFRKLLEQKDIDAVIIGTPDHWHALNLILACEAGKDAYCEKPLSHDIVEAKAMDAAVKKYKKIVQVGTWQRSTREFADAIEFVRSGKLGKVVLCRAWISDGFRAGRQRPQPVPSNLDYDFWTGPAAMVPYKPNHVHYNWRWFMNYGGGLSTDWGVHMMDIALLGMSKDQNLVMPSEVTSYGGNLAIVDDDRDAPDTMEAIYRFRDPDFVMQWSIGRDHPGKPGHGTEFVSADGRTLRVWRGGWVVLDPDGKELPKEQAEPVGDHWRNWLDCVKTRAMPRADHASLVRTTIVCHLSNVSLQCGETVHWDKAKNDIAGKTGRNTPSYQRPYRKPWALPMHKP